MALLSCIVGRSLRPLVTCVVIPAAVLPPYRSHPRTALWVRRACCRAATASTRTVPRAITPREVDGWRGGWQRPTCLYGALRVVASVALAASAMTRVSALEAGKDEEERARRDARRIFTAACRAVEPKAAVNKAVALKGSQLHIAGQVVNLAEYPDVVVLAAGKASVGMAEALQEILGPRLKKGVVVTKDGHSVGHRLGQNFEVLESSHPTPDERSVAAAARLMDAAAAAGPRTLVLCCLSGGFSALVCAPAEGISLADKLEATRQLLACGCPIGDKNVVLKHLSRIKGGHLMELVQPAALVAMVLSDVIGDPLDTICSGPTVPDPSTFHDALRILEKYGIMDSFPQSCLSHLRRGSCGEVRETPKACDRGSMGSVALTAVVAGNVTAVEAAVAEAERLGYNTMILSTSMEGEASEVGKVMSAIAKEEARFQRPIALPACIVAGGETTVTLPPSPGVGGRSQALALSACLCIRDLPGVALLAGGTDGGDGPDNDAAGAVVTGSDAAVAEQAGLDAGASMRRCDSYGFFQQLELAKYGRTNVLHLRDGPTGTNVADLVVLIVRPPALREST
mmetsp:Transcript_42643/g.123930  ORF Transcript_42643/g.123930 Transcript_42643/m.123930 type:complete len:570 (+) Transcript_42643:61-1770(+)